MLIAIVDDEPLVLKSMARVIEEKYPEVKTVCCRNAAEALKVLKEISVDAVITDVCMPGMDGIELCKKIKEENHAAEVVMISGYSDFEYVKKAMSYGVRQYILKPVNSTKLAELMAYLKSVEAEKAGEEELRRRIGSNTITRELNDMLWSGNISGIQKIVFPEDISYKSGGVIRSYAMFLVNVLSFFIKSNKLEAVNEEDMFTNATSKSGDRLMLEYVMEKYAEVAERIKGGTEAASVDSKAAEIRLYIDRNYSNQALSREMLAEQFGLSVRHMSRLFTRQYNKGIQEYIMNVRIEQAKKLLRNSSLPINTIVSTVGYNSLTYFKQLFKEQTGQTMGDYRNGGGDGGRQ